MNLTPATPTVRDLLDYAVSKGVVGEETCFVTAALALISPNLNVLIESPSGAGKTTIVRPVVALHEHYQISTGSEKNAIYDDDLLPAKLVFIPELQKAVISGDFVIEMLKAWGEGEPFTYSVTYKNEKGMFKVQKRVIPPKNFITTFAVGNKHGAALDAELGRRLIRLFTDTSVEMNKRVIKEYAKVVAGRTKGRKVISTARLQGHLSSARARYETTEVIVPYSEAIGDAIDDSFVVSRSIYKQMIELIKCIALFGQPSWLDKGEVTIVANMDTLTTFRDYVFDNLQAQAMQLPTLGVRVLEVFEAGSTDTEQVLLFEDDTTISMSPAEVQKQMRTLGYVIDTKVLVEGMDRLVEAGYLQLDESARGRVKRYRTTGYERQSREIDMAAARKQYETFLKSSKI